MAEPGFVAHRDSHAPDGALETPDVRKQVAFEFFQDPPIPRVRYAGFHHSVSGRVKESSSDPYFKPASIALELGAWDHAGLTFFAGGFELVGYNQLVCPAGGGNQVGDGKVVAVSHPELVHFITHQEGDGITPGILLVGIVIRSASGREYPGKRSPASGEPCTSKDPYPAGYRCPGA